MNQLRGQVFGAFGCEAPKWVWSQLGLFYTEEGQICMT